MNEIIKESFETCMPVVLQTNGIWDTNPCLVSNLAPEGFVAHYNTSSKIFTPASIVTDAKLAGREDSTQQLERVAALIY